MTDPRRLVYMPVDDLPEAPRNPKGHADDVIDASMDRFGYTDPIELDERTGRIVSGHGRKHRLQSRRAAGAPAPDGVVVRDDGVWTVPVVRGWASKDDAEAEAYVIGANRTVEAGGWDRQALYDALSDLGDGPGLAGIGYSDMDLDDLLASLQEQAPEEYGTAGAHDDETAGERGQRYAGNGIRSLMLDYPVDRFDELVAGLARYRRAHGLPTNADAVAGLIEAAVAGLDAT